MLYSTFSSHREWCPLPGLRWDCVSWGLLLLACHVHVNSTYRLLSERWDISQAFSCLFVFSWFSPPNLSHIVFTWHLTECSSLKHCQNREIQQEEIAAGSCSLPNVIHWSGAANNDLCRQSSLGSFTLSARRLLSKQEKKKWNSLCSQLFGFAVHLDSELSSAALFCSHIVPHVNNSPEFSHHDDFLCPFLSWSESAGMKTMHNSQSGPGAESNASLCCIFLSLTFFPGMQKKKKTKLYYFNKFLVLIHYWSSGWSTGHCITTILKPIMAWHSCTCEKLYQLWNQPTTTSKSNQLSHWKAFYPPVLSALWLHKKEWALGLQWLPNTNFSPFFPQTIHSEIVLLWSKPRIMFDALCEPLSASETTALMRAPCTFWKPLRLWIMISELCTSALWGDIVGIVQMPQS